MHYIEYYHEEVLLYQIAFLGYKPPEGEYYIGIPDHLFPQPNPAKVLRYEDQNANQMLTPKVELVDSLWPDKRSSGQYTRYRFNANATEVPIDWTGWTVQWDFGDSQQAKGPTTDHVFLLIGSYKVKLTAIAPDGGKMERLWPLEVFPVEHLSESFTTGLYKDYQPFVANYDLTKLSPAMLFELAKFHDETGDRDTAVETARMVLDRVDALDSDCFEAHLFLAADAGKPQASWYYMTETDAVKHLQSAIELSKEPVVKIQIIARFIRHLGVDQRDVQAAEKQYLLAKSLIQKNILRGQLKHVFRNATIAIGDTHLCAGETDKALEDYKTAEALAEPIIPSPVRSAKIGSYPQRITQLIESHQFEEAGDVVMEWYEQLPADIPRGEVLFWMGKLEIQRGSYHTAIRPLKEALKLVHGAPFEAETYWLLAEAYQQIKDEQNQCAVLELFLRSGLSSIWRDKAIQMLEKIEQK